MKALKGKAKVGDEPIGDVLMTVDISDPEPRYAMAAEELAIAAQANAKAIRSIALVLKALA